MIFEVARYFVGGFFLCFGLDGFFHFLPPPKVAPRMEKFAEHLVQARFILPTVKTVEIIGGILLLTNCCTQLAIVMLFPIVFGILFSQLIFNWAEGYKIVALTVVPYFVLVTGYWSEFFAFFYRVNLHA